MSKVNNLTPIYIHQSLFLPMHNLFAIFFFFIVVKKLEIWKPIINIRGKKYLIFTKHTLTSISLYVRLAWIYKFMCNMKKLGEKGGIKAFSNVRQRKPIIISFFTFMQSRYLVKYKYKKI